MLSPLRRLLRSKLSAVLFGLVILAMAVWGVEDVFSANLGSDLIRAGDRRISPLELSSKFDRLVDDARESSGQPLTRAEAIENGALEQLIARESARAAFVGYAMDLNADGDEEAVLDQIRASDIFIDPATGAFSLQRYDTILQSNGLTRDLFRRDVADNLAIDYLRGAVVSAVKTPNTLARLQAALDGERRRAAWFVLSEDTLPEAEPPTEDELRAFYDERIEAFVEPERRRLSLISVSAADYEHAAEVSDADIEAFYEAFKTSRYAAPPTRTWVEASFAGEAGARSALGLLAGGGDPASLADAAALNARTAAESDISDPLFAEALFGPAAQPGAVFGPYERDGGFLVARLETINPGEPQPLADVAEEIRAVLAGEAAESAYLDAVARLPDLIGAGATLQEIASELGAPLFILPAIDSRGVTARGALLRQVAATDGALEAAFTLPVGAASTPIDGPVGTMVLAVDEVVDPRTPDFDEIRDRVEQGFIFIRDSDALGAAVEAARSAIEGGGSTLEAEAAKVGATVQRTQQPLTRTSQDFAGLPRSAVGAVFSAREGDIATTPGPGPGETTIVLIESVEALSPAELTAAELAASVRLAPELENDLFAAFQTDIVGAVEVDTNEAGITAYRNSLIAPQ